MANRTTSETLQSAKSLMEAPNSDIIVAGGPSSSQLLNDLRDAVIEDVMELDRRTEDLSARISLANSIFNTQITMFASRLQSLEARLPSTSGRWLVDMFTSDFIHSTNSAAVNTTYGQATLPILSTLEKLVIVDTRGEVAVPKATQVHYSYKTGTPDETDWLTDDNAIYALDQRSDTAWWATRTSSGAVWVRVIVPASLNANKFANAIVLHPFPALSFDLHSIEYRNPQGVWTSADLTYIEGWDGSKVNWMGNIRAFVPQTQVTELRIKIATAGVWGFSRISLQQIEFSPSATLVVNFVSYVPSAISTVNVLGKDQSALSYLTKTVNGYVVSVAMTQLSQNSSPIVTGVEAVR
jgi:hypothetical protein